MYFLLYLWEIFQDLWNINVTEKKENRKNENLIFLIAWKGQNKNSEKRNDVFFLNHLLYAGD